MPGMLRFTLCALAALLLGCQDSDDPAADPEPTGDVAEDTGPTYDPAADLEAAFELLNARRVASGLTEITTDDELDTACLHHVRYMRAEAKVVHEEDESSEYYTESGANSAANAVLAGGVIGLEDAITRWLASL